MSTPFEEHAERVAQLESLAKSVGATYSINAKPSGGWFVSVRIPDGGLGTLMMKHRASFPEALTAAIDWIKAQGALDKMAAESKTPQEPGN